MSNASCYPCPFCLGFRLTYEGEDTLRTFWHIVHYGDQWTALAEVIGDYFNAIWGS